MSEEAQYENDPDFQIARFGVQVEKFMSSEIGRYLLGCADQEVEEAKELLTVVEPGMVNEIQALQNRIWQARSVRQWLEDAVRHGHMAMVNIEAEETGDE